MKTSTLVVCLFLCPVVFAASPEARTWTSVDGRTIDAEFVAGDSGSVTVKRSDGRVFKIPIRQLSNGDRRYVREQIIKLKAAERGDASGGSAAPSAGPPNVSIDTSKPWTPVRQDIAAALQAAPVVPVEDVLEPVHTVRYDGDDNLIWAPNPDGKTWDVLPVYFNGYGGASTLPVIDLGSGEVKVNNYPRGVNWHLCPNVLAPSGKVYISAMRGPRVSIHVYDPATNKLQLDAVKVPDHVRGETHPLIRSTDGMLFAGGGHPSKAASCVMIDPRDNSVTDFGPCGPSHSPTRCYNYFMGADDTHVYIASGKVPWYLVAVDRKTKQSKVLAKTAPEGGLITVYQDTHGVKANVRESASKKRQDYWCHQGKLVPRSAPCPWPNTGQDWQKALPPKPELYTENIVPIQQGQPAELWVKQTIRGAAQDRKHPGWTRFSYDVPVYALLSDRLVEMPDGRLFGTAGSYAGHYIFDPASGKCQYMGKTDLSHYATAIHGNKLWLSGYPSSRLYSFDYTKPWNVSSAGAGPGTKRPPLDSPDSNPRLLGSLAESRCHKMYGAAVGASGRIYFGGRWMRTGNGGGLGWWDPKTNTEKGLWEQFSNQQIGFVSAAGEGKYIVVSTIATKDIVLKKPLPKEGKLFVFDDAKQQIVREITPVEGVAGPGPIAWAGGNRVIGWTTDPANETQSILYGVNVEKGEVAWRIPLPVPLAVKIGSNQEEAWDFRLGPDGKIWTFMGPSGKTLVRIDPQTALIEPVCRVDKGGRLAFSPPDVYLSGTTALRRIGSAAKVKQ